MEKGKEKDFINKFNMDNPLEYIDMHKAETYEDFIEAMNECMIYISDIDMFLFKSTNIKGEFAPITMKKLPIMFDQPLDVEDNGKITKKTKKNIIKENIKKKIKNVTFRPYAPNEEYKENKKYFNLYNNDKINYDENFKYNLNIIEPIIKHFKILCNNNENHSEYVLNWMAHIVQNPNEKTRVCLVFKSKQGAGKSSIWNWFGNNIIGKQWFLNINDAHYLLDNKFNGELLNKIFTVLDEAQTNGKYITGNERMKTRITEDYIRVEKKGQESYIVEDKNNYVLLTNNEFPVKVDNSDRRYFCIESSNELIKNKDYFKKYFKLLKNEEITKNFYYFLLNKDLSNFDIEDIPETTLKTDIRFDSSPNPIKFAIDIISDGLKYENNSLNEIFSNENDNNVTFADTQKLYKCYKQFVIEKCPNERIYQYKGFINKFNELLNIKTKKAGPLGEITMINKDIIINGIKDYFNIDDISKILPTQIIYDEGYNSG